MNDSKFDQGESNEKRPPAGDIPAHVSAGDMASTAGEKEKFIGRQLRDAGAWHVPYPWTHMTQEEMAKLLIAALYKWPLSQYDNVTDENPYSLTVKDIAISAVIGNDVALYPTMRSDWIAIMDGFVFEIEEFLKNCPRHVGIWEEKDPRICVGYRLLDKIIRRSQKVENWCPAKLTRILHRKRPLFVPILDEVVVSRTVAMLMGVVPPALIGDRACEALLNVQDTLSEHIGKISDACSQCATVIPELRGLSPVRAVDIMIRMERGAMTHGWDGDGCVINWK